VIRDTPRWAVRRRGGREKALAPPPFCCSTACRHRCFTWNTPGRASQGQTRRGPSRGAWPS